MFISFLKLLFSGVFSKYYRLNLFFIVCLYANLKEITVVVGIQKKRSHHLARRTFTTTVLLFNDVPMEIVSALLGHATMSVTQESYAKIVNKKIGSAMAVFYKVSAG
jgi:site-specific recombinase XerD